jgi:hypothetical protein
MLERELLPGVAVEKCDILYGVRGNSLWSNTGRTSACSDSSFSVYPPALPLWFLAQGEALPSPLQVTDRMTRSHPRIPLSMTCWKTCLRAVLHVGARAPVPNR